MLPLSDVLNGLSLACAPQNLFFALAGACLGTFVGVLPGLGPTSGIAILLPLTTILPPTPAIIMLAGIYYGAMYGGSTTSILMNVPGELSSVVTCLYGYALARQGKAGVALAIAAISSFVAGTLGLLGLTFFAGPLAGIALDFGPPEYFALSCFALTMVVGLSHQSPLKGVIAALLGFLLTVIGQDVMTGQPRFNLGWERLISGIDFVPVVVGLFAISEIMLNAEEKGKAIYQKVTRLYPTWNELRQTIGTMLRSSVSGFFFGLLPGCTPGAISFLAYDLERRLSKRGDRFGTGELQGVAAPEGANNAATSGGFVPLFSLGIPTTPSLAVLLSGLMIYGLQPGPMLFAKHPKVVWTVIGSMYIGNVMLLILNLPLVGLWASIIRVPYHYLAPAILALSVVGTFSVRNSLFDVWMALIFGGIGYLMNKLSYPTAPLVLALVLGQILEQSFRQSLSMSGGSPLLFLSRPFALVLLLCTLVYAGFALVTSFRRRESGTRA
ncbi:MAG: tripartite tricarboxylate transporter permease [Deltaproteobacteria bacterium]|nr:MAG: tripartite tricarboxylate transporter permease [Deltaproteobacteria bacterium]